MKVKMLLLGTAAAAALFGCAIKTENEIHVKADPIEIKPVEVKISIDVNVKVDKELDSFFGDLDK